jgi:hypothetical protein
MRTKRDGGISVKAKAAMVLGTILAAGAITTGPDTQRSLSTPRQATGETKLAAPAQGERSQPLQASQSGGNQSSAAVTIGGGLGHTFLFRSLGHGPKEWGMSAACARMVRKNRLHAHGLSHARI